MHHLVETVKKKRFDVESTLHNEKKHMVPCKKMENG